MRLALTVRNAVVLVLVGAMALAGIAVPASAAPVTGSAGGGLVAGSGMVTLVAPAAGGATIQATPAQSFCYVGVSWPAAILPDGRATATWSLDCRSLANPNLPAPDIGGATLEVRIFQGEYTPWDSGTMIKGTACLSVANPRPSCPVTTDTPLQFGVPYYTRLDVKVVLTGGLEPVGAFVTDPIRRS